MRKKNLILFCIGFFAYPIIEILWRGKTHWSMSLLGGVCCLSVCKFFQRFSEISLLKKCVCGSIMITFAEFCCGCVVNLKMKLNVWNYENLKFNLKGQICLLYSILWGLLCIPINTLSRLLSNEKQRNAASTPAFGKHCVTKTVR